MQRPDIINCIENKRGRLDETILKSARFKHNPFRAIWFYFLVFLNRCTPLLFKIKATTVWGDKMYAYETSAIGSMYFLGFYDIETTLFLLKNHKTDGDILDIGSNIGTYALLGRNLLNENYMLYAFEPTPSTFAVLKDNVAAHKNIIPVQIALSDNVGTIPFIDYGKRHGVFNSAQAQSHTFLKNKGLTIEVPADTLDNYCQKHDLRPSLIKLDTEGTEASILESGTEVLEKYKPVILLEVGGGEAWAANTKRCLDLLTAKNYSFFELDTKGQASPHKRKEVYSYDNLVCIPESKISSYV